MIAVVQPDPVCPPGHVADVLEARSLDWDVLATHDGASLPDRPAAAIVLGGSMGAYEEVDHAHLAATKAWLRRLVAADVPVLGICLGAQLIADALGGRAYLAQAPEIGLLPVRPVTDDALVAVLGGDWVMVHQDTFTVPPGGRLIAESGFPAVFRAGSATGVQFHPEAGPDLVGAWLHRAGGLGERAGVDPTPIVGRLIDEADDFAERGRALIGAWVDEATER